MVVAPLVRRLIANRSIKFKDGTLRIWGIPAAIYSLFTMTYMSRLLEQGHAGKDVYYWAGYHQALGATHTMKKRFGYKQKVLEVVLQHGEMLGLGKVHSKLANFNDCKFIISHKSEFALEYKKVFGIQKHAVCHFFRGQCAGMIDGLIEGKSCVAIEKKCIAKGDPVCEIVVMSPEQFDRDSQIFKEQNPEQLPSPVDFGFSPKTVVLPQREL